jgi:hypothetical protein
MWNAVGVADDRVEDCKWTRIWWVRPVSMRTRRGEGAVGGDQALECVDVERRRAAIGTAGGHAGATDEVSGDGRVTVVSSF